MKREKKIIAISGMDCASCAVTIENSLKGTRGVISASVNFASGKAEIEYDQAITSLKKIEEAIEAGADTMKRIAAPLIGGLTTSMLLTLIVLPAIYTIWKGREFNSGAPHSLMPAPIGRRIPK